MATLNNPNVDIVEHAVAQCILAFSIKHDAGWSPAQFYRLSVMHEKEDEDEVNINHAGAWWTVLPLFQVLAWCLLSYTCLC